MSLSTMNNTPNNDSPESTQDPVAGGTVFHAENTTVGQRMARRWKKWRFWIIGAAVFVLLSVLAFVAGNSGDRSINALAINNPAPAGAQAATSVLRQQGVDVSATDSLAQTTDALGHNGYGNSTVLFYDPKNLLTPDQVGDLAAAAKDNGARLVAITPGPLAVRKLSPELSSAGVSSGAAVVPAGCENADAVAAGSISGSGENPAFDPGPSTGPPLLYKGAQICFTPHGQDSATVGGFLASNSSGDVFAVGFSGVVNNHNLARGGNAALSFRLLGSKANLLWYTPSINDVAPTQNQPSISDLTPQWMFPVAAWLMLVALVGMVWRGRRNGPLVAEPLPVIVKASETMVGRARLYQDARAVDTATATLQHATLTRLAQALRLGHSAEPDAVVEAVATATGRRDVDVYNILLGQSPTTEKDMLTIAAALAALEEEVARR